MGQRDPLALRDDAAGSADPSLSEQEDVLPPPGNARRRLLRQLGIRFTRADFDAEEQEAMRPWRGPGWYRHASTPNGHDYWDGERWDEDETSKDGPGPRIPRTRLPE